MENVTARDPEPPFESQRIEHLAVIDDLADVGDVLLDQADNTVAEGLAQLVPCAFP